MADDLGWRDLGCYGSTFHQTPNLDTLAARDSRKLTPVRPKNSAVTELLVALVAKETPEMRHI